MSNSLTKREQALEACDKVVNGIEDGTISVSSSLLLCKKIARLVNDLAGQEWLSYEYGGYPNIGGIPPNAWIVGVKHGRAFKETNKDGKVVELMFTELCGELEASIESSMKAIGNFTTQGYSAAGEWAALATSNMTNSVSTNTCSLLMNIRTAQKRLSVLKSQYYDYAVRWQIDLQFGNTAKHVFEEYQEKVDQYYSLLPTTALQKLYASRSASVHGGKVKGEVSDFVEESATLLNRIIRKCAELGSLPDAENLVFPVVATGSTGLSTGVSSAQSIASRK